MAAFDANEILRASRIRPQKTVDGQPVLQRGSRFGGNYVYNVLSGVNALADEGSYFTAQNPTPGTGVAHALTTTFTNTAALFSFFNKAPPDGARIYLHYARLIFTAVPATSTVHDFVVDIDTSLNRAPTANNTTITPVNPNGDDGTQSLCGLQAFNAGSLTVPASTAATRRAARFRAVTGQVIAGDCILIQFGSLDFAQSRSPLTAVRATDPGFILVNAPPVILGPGNYGTLLRWSATETTTAPSFEYELGWWER
jgi:hypothetical protein